MSMYHFNIFKESKDNDHITAILTYSDTTYTPTYKLLVFLKSISSCYYIPSNSLLYLQKYAIDEYKNYIFMFGKDWSFCNQNLQYAAILHKKFKIFIFICFNFNSTFFSIIFSIETFHSAVAFRRCQIHWLFLNVQRVIVVRKISMINKGSYLNTFIVTKHWYHPRIWFHRSCLECFLIGFQGFNNAFFKGKNKFCFSYLSRK